MTTQTRTIRTVAGIINSVQTLEGEGMLFAAIPQEYLFRLRPPFLLDELGPVDFEQV